MTMDLQAEPQLCEMVGTGVVALLCEEPNALAVESTTLEVI